MTQANVDTLFRPFTIKGVTLPNRIVMAPMTRLFAPNGVPGEANAAYYRRRAAAGVGLILSEGTVIDRPSSRNEVNIPSFFGDAALAGWRHVIDEVHAAGGRMGPQIWHTGGTRGRYGWVPPKPAESPSGFNGPDDAHGVAMTDEDIADTIAAFASAAASAKALGFDVVELHGAHGYLIDQFFWNGSNQRDDRFGGATLAQRSRFAADVIAAARQAIGPGMPLILRVSQWKQQDYKTRLAHTPAEMEAWLAPLVAAGVDILHCSQRRFWEPEFPGIDGEEGLNFAGWAKKITGAATISVGSVGLSGEFLASFGGESSAPEGLDRLVQRLDRNEFDLIAVGRALLGDPEWVTKVRNGDTHNLKAFNPASMAELV
ncbi:NADH:flavin oxidoreductase [Bacillus sp. NP157]|nr:NADH:flavin oxidoreductase [Bacillus sp. NP157]